MIGELIGFFVSLIFIGVPAVIFGIPIFVAFLSLFVKIVYEYEKGVLFAFGKFAGVREPGFNLIVPIYHRLEKVDLRVTTAEIPKQEVMTKDNVPVNINAVIYFKVDDPSKAVLDVEDYFYAVTKFGQTSLRNVTGQATLDELLSERQQIADKIREIVDTGTKPWGIDITAIELQDIELPEGLKRTMAKQAEAERERRATVINSEGEVIASNNLAKAAKILSGVKGALHLRTLQSLNDISSDNSNTVVFTVPLEVLRSFEEVD